MTILPVYIVVDIKILIPDTSIHIYYSDKYQENIFISSSISRFEGL